MVLDDDFVKLKVIANKINHMDKNKIKNEKIERRHRKIRQRISGTKDVPRLCVFRSNKYIYAEVIDDNAGETLFSASSIKLKAKNKTESAHETGKVVAREVLNKKIRKIVFDRGGYVYAGRVKALADGAREGGLIF